MSVWLATIVCTPSARPLGVNDHAPLASVITVEAVGVPSIVKYTAVLARPVPLSASFEVMLSLGDVPALKVSFAVIGGAVVLGANLTGRLVALTVELEVVAGAVLVMKRKVVLEYRLRRPG